MNTVVKAASSGGECMYVRLCMYIMLCYTLYIQGVPGGYSLC